MDNNEIKNLFDKTKITKPLILDGACGCLLQEKNPEFYDDDIWMTKINRGKPEEVGRVAKLYLDSGANIITTNTFRTNTISLNTYNTKNTTDNKAKLNSEEEVKTAFDILHKLRKDNQHKPFLIAGSNPPSEDCYIKKQVNSYEAIKDNHIDHINLLYKYGADIILNETMSFSNEVDICQKYCFQNNINYIVSLYIDNDLKLNSGEKLIHMLKKIDELKPLAISVNCISVKIFKDLIKEGESIIKSLKCGFGYYLNCGDPKNTETNYLENNFNPFVTPKDYVEVIKEYGYLKPVMVGSCCMSTPDHTQEIYNYYNSK